MSRIRDDFYTDVGIFLEHGYYHNTKTIDIFGEITEDMMYSTLRKLHVADERSGAVTIRLSSEGGCVQSGLGIYNGIINMKNEVRIIVYSECSSIATVILQAGDVRYMTKDSYLLLHEGTVETPPMSKKSEQNFRRLTGIFEKRCYDIYYESVKAIKRISRKRLIDKIEESDWILTAQEAIEWGLADEIIEVY